MGNEPGSDVDDKLAPPRLGFRRKKERPAPKPEEQAADDEPTQVLETPEGPVQESTSEGAESTKQQPLEPAGGQAAAPDVPEPTQVIEPVEKDTDAEPRGSKVTREPKQAKAPKPAKEPKERPKRPPLLGGHLAAAVIGLVVGLFMVVAVWGCERVSQSVRGTTALGKAGFPLLLAIFILAVLIGVLLLRQVGTPSPGSTSFLGTGLVSVLSILFLTDHADSLWGLALIVVIAIASFVLARWISVHFIDTTDDA